ncbi:MAG: hypothetical protein KDK45_25990, partial [Leptospiraceae bacterium]|nr:hypothetical protein [Leptospiraceae bacterium]
MIKLFHFILPVRKIAAITILLSLLSFLLTLFPGEKLGAEDGPVGIVLGQTIWNAAQVGFLFILFQLFFSYQKWWFKFISILSIALLPFSVYLISPGGYIYLVLILLISVLVFILPPRNLEVNLLDSKILPKTSLYRFELLAFTCNLACSLYNYNSAKDCWPYWHRMFIKLGALLGLVFKPEEFSEKMFTLGLKEFNMPVFVPAGVGNNVGSVIFLLIWSILPFLYVAYFAILFQLSKRSYGTRIQQALCLFSIFHFLFLTDMVDYGFGRGIINPYAEWCHWTE